MTVMRYVHELGDLPELLLQFDHHELDRGVVQFVTLRSGRVLLGTTTQEEPQVLVSRGNLFPQDMERVGDRLWALLEGRIEAFVIKAMDRLAIKWQVVNPKMSREWRAGRDAKRPATAIAAAPVVGPASAGLHGV